MKQDEITSNTVSIDATYSAEDNKLRLYASERLDPELFARVKAMGFKWAPKQELFVAPKWTPSREDFCLELAGEISAEQTTLIERAEAKAERLDSLAEKRAEQSNAFHAAANRLSEHFHGGQPILIGHHSERSARRVQKQMHNATRNAIKAANAVDYWHCKAGGVERHANRKGDDGVRSRRIKTLLVELRDRQRSINHAQICLQLWTKIDTEADAEKREKAIKYYSGATLSTGSAAPYYSGDSLWRMLERGDISPDEAVKKCLAHYEWLASHPTTLRFIAHILNRLAYERSELGPVKRYAGELTATILQTFAREHGAHKPKAKAKKKGDQWQLSSTVPLPLHMADGKSLVLSDEAWRELMQSSGYEVPDPKPAKPPILNFKAAYIKGHSWGGMRTFRQMAFTKAEYSAIYADYRGVKVSECGTFRFKVCKNPAQQGYDAEWVAVFMFDSKRHDAPESAAISHKSEEATA